MCFPISLRVHSERACNCSVSMRLAPVLISDSDIISSVQAVGPDIIRVNEFTTVVDDRQPTPTVGYLIELAEAPGLSIKVIIQ